jgi:drug/metabolite transporter (DMT)-like permease
MDPLALILLQNIGAAAFAIVSRKAAPRLRHSYFQFTAIVLSVELLAGLLWAMVYGGVYLADLWRWLPFLAVGGAAFAITNALSFKVFQHVDAAIASLLSTFNIIAAIIISTLVIKEGLTAQTGLGGLMIVAASWVVLSAHVGRQQRHAWTLGLILSVAAALFFGLATVNEKYLLDNMGLSSYLVWGWGFQVLAAFAFSLCMSREGYGEIMRAKVFKLLGVAGIIRAISGLCFVLALVALDNLAVMSALSGLKIILAAFFGLLFLGEGQFAFRKIGASVLAAVGVAVMFW